MDPHLRPVNLSSAALATLCALLWGGVAIMVQFSQDDLPPIAVAGTRFAISVPFLFLWFRLAGTSLAPRKEEWKGVVTVAVIMTAQIAVFHSALDHTSSAHASVIIGMNPVVVAVMAHFGLKGERLSLKRWGGLAIALAGLVVIVGMDPTSGDVRDPVSLFGDLIMFGSCLLLGFKIAASKKILRTVDPGRLLVWSHILGSALLFSLSAALEHDRTFRFTTGTVLALAYLGIVVSVFCFGMWTILLKKHPAGQLQVFAFAQPVFGLLLGAMFRGDPLTIWLGIGTGAILLGIVLVTRDSSSQPSKRTV